MNNFIIWFGKIDRRWLYLLMAIVVSIPIFMRMKMKVKPAEPVIMLYDFIENLEPMDTILISFDYSPDSLAELQPMAKALIYHALNKDVRILGIALAWPSAAGLGLDAMKGEVHNYNKKILGTVIENLFENTEISKYIESKKMKKELFTNIIADLIPAHFEDNKSTISVNKKLYAILEKQSVFSKVDSKTLKLIGRDWDYFGYKPGYALVMLGMGSDMIKTLNTDYFGNELKDFDMFSNPTYKIKNYDNISVVIDLAAGGSPGAWMTYVNTKFGRPVATGVTAVMAADYYPFLQSKQLIGLLNGMRGAADYETLINKPGLGLQGMGSQTFAHLLIIAFIILGNLGYLASKKSGGENE
ncbi:hypothetical protein J7L48_06195 [bacterium]|nr:hypothetical protein [bacterium]